MRQIKLSAKKDRRTNLLRNLATSLILYEKIITSEAKAKAVRPIIEKMINIGKRKDLSSRRRLLAYFPDKNAAKKIIEDISPKYQDKVSGYIQIFRISSRIGDNSSQVLMRLIPVKTSLEDIKKKEEKTAKLEVKNETNKKK